MEDTGKKGLGQKLKDKLHIGHSHKGSAASDESSYSNQVQVCQLERLLHSKLSVDMAAVTAMGLHIAGAASVNQSSRRTWVLQHPNFHSAQLRGHTISVTWFSFSRDPWAQPLQQRAASSPALLLECSQVRVQHQVVQAHSQLQERELPDQTLREELFPAPLPTWERLEAHMHHKEHLQV